ncbi:transposase, MuDR, MULE transposase domain protein [Tanacetum coccineum]
MQKSLNWVVVGIAVGRVYEVDDRRRIQTVELCNGTCTCRKWQVSGLPCGHVLAICRVIGLTDCHRLAKGWFMRIALKGTYQELVYPVGEVSSWQIPNDMSVVKPPHMDKQPSGRPKSTKRIRSQGEEPVTVRCGRCGARGHNRQGCRETISIPKERTYPRGSSQQADDYLPQSMSWSFDAVNLKIYKLTRSQRSVDHPVPEVVAPEVIALVLADSTGSPSSTIVDKDAPSLSNSQTTPETEPPVIQNDVEEDNHDIEVAHMGYDPYFGVSIPEIPSDQPSSSDFIPYQLMQP